MARRRRPKADAVHAALLRKCHKDGTYERLLEAQGGVCPLCERNPEEIALASKHKRVQRLDIDHHHGSMNIRGLLCRGDNLKLRRGITSEWCYRAGDYLKRAGE